MLQTSPQKARPFDAPVPEVYLTNLIVGSSLKMPFYNPQILNEKVRIRAASFYESMKAALGAAFMLFRYIIFCLKVFNKTSWTYILLVRSAVSVRRTLLLESNLSGSDFGHKYATFYSGAAYLRQRELL